MRAFLKNAAFSENATFDGQGRIRMLENYIANTAEEAEIWEDDDEEASGEDEAVFEVNKQCLSHISDCLKEAFEGNSVKLSYGNAGGTDYVIGVDVTEDSVRFYGDDDRPFNGYDPMLSTNIFSMDIRNA